MVDALLKEVDLTIKNNLSADNHFDLSETIDTIYFGGGTPSLLTHEDLNRILAKIKAAFIISSDAEITIEANPDDITEDKLIEWKSSGINRLSIGIQSFYQEDLEWMNRAHNKDQAKQCIELAHKHGFYNISIDLIYGTPLLTNEKWQENVKTALSFNIPHLSCYALTIEPKTLLHKLIEQKKVEDVNPDLQSEQFLLLMKWLQEAGYEHYEISNFAKPGFRSRHNSSYWKGKKYFGFGPSAHSYDGENRFWNISNNNVYITTINDDKIPFEKETLSHNQRLNEMIMISLRTMEGLSLQNFELLAGEKNSTQLLNAADKYINSGLLNKENSHLILTDEGKLLADGIAADLFLD